MDLNYEYVNGVGMFLDNQPENLPVITKRDKAALISLVVPVFNEQQALPNTYQILSNLMQENGYNYEVIVTDNGSTDDTEAIMQQTANEDPRWKYIRLSRNFGYQNSITLGMSAAQGDAIIVIDADLQDPPDLIPVFVEHWRQGYDVVYGVREKRIGESKMRVFLTMNAMRIISWMADYPLPAHSADFRLISRQARDAFIQMPENSRFVRGMIHWVGFKQIGIPYTRQGRRFGGEDRKWFGEGIIPLIKVMLDAIFSFSLKPLRLFSVFGATVVFLSVMMFVVYFTLRIMDQNLPRGFTSQMLISVVHLGVTALGIGVLGEYVGRVYTETKRRPLWIIDYTLNLDKSTNIRPPQEADIEAATQKPYK